MKCVHLYLLSLFCGTVFLSSQTQWQQLYLPAVIEDSSKASIQFERNVHTYMWNAHSNYIYYDSSAFFSLSDHFTSTLIQNQFRSFRDEQNFSFTASQKISDIISLASEGESFILSDNQTLGSSNAGIHSGVIGFTYHPDAHISITPLIGMRYDKQQIEKDEGVNYRLSSVVDSILFNDYRASLSGYFNQTDAERRRFKNNSAALSIATEFAKGSTDSVQVRWFLNRNDFYIPADSSVIRGFGVPTNIRSRTEQQWEVLNLLGYELGNGFTSELSAAIETRTITNAFRYKNFLEPNSILFNTTVQELRLTGGFEMNYNAPSTFATLGFKIDERDEKHVLERIDGITTTAQDARERQESRLDNTAVRSTLHSDIITSLSQTDDLSFSGSLSVLQYDTPDTLNSDDRDELLISLSLREQHTFNTVFSAAVTAEATLAHIVYLKREKSANNNWNRIFRLSPELKYRPSSSFAMFNSFDVLANYTVFDFESLIPSVKSYSYRQVAFLDSTSYDITRSVGIDLFAHVRILERGEFHWQEFSERPLQRIEEVTFSPQVRYRLKDQWMFAVGFRSFAQKRFRYENNVRKYESTYLSAGPTTNIRIALSAYSLLHIQGWKEFQRISGGTIREFSNVSMTIRYLF